MMYNQVEILQILNSCKTVDEVMAVIEALVERSHKYGEMYDLYFLQYFSLTKIDELLLWKN